MKFKITNRAGVRSGTAGNLYVKLTLRTHEFYTIRHDSIWCRTPIFTKTLTLDWKIDITLPPNVKTTLVNTNG
ncbi:MAG: hypothetical protein ACTS4Y_00780 [Candidatus Hodgkinia cicadicola]